MNNCADKINEQKRRFTAAVITISDSGAAGKREDLSGRYLIEELTGDGYEIKGYEMIPDDPEVISEKLCLLSDGGDCDLILTTGGTGLSPRDNTPEATLSVIDKNVPGISEALRAYSMTITPRAMLSRGVSGIRKSTLIINFPGSTNACREYYSYLSKTGSLTHALEILKGYVTQHNKSPRTKE